MVNATDSLSLSAGQLKFNVFRGRSLSRRAISPGESVGEIGLLTGESRSATIWAARDSRLVRIGRQAFDALAEDNPNLLRSLAKVVVDLLRKRTCSYRYTPPVSNIAIIPTRAKNGGAQFAEELRTTLARISSTLHVNSQRIDDLVGVSGISMALPGSVSIFRPPRTTNSTITRFLVR